MDLDHQMLDHQTHHHGDVGAVQCVMGVRGGWRERGKTKDERERQGEKMSTTQRNIPSAMGHSKKIR